MGGLCAGAETASTTHEPLHAWTGASHRGDGVPVAGVPARVSAGPIRAAAPRVRALSPDPSWAPIDGTEARLVRHNLRPHTYTHAQQSDRREGAAACLARAGGIDGGRACIRPALPQGCYDHPAAPATNAALSLPMRVSVDRARPVQGRDSCFSATDSLYQVFTGRTRSQPLSRWWGGWRRRRRGRVSGRTPGGHHRRPGQEPVLWKGEVVR
jgi:hypothetical protein